MNKNDDVNAIDEITFEIVLWPGYRQPRTWGNLYIVQIPSIHPDTHCEGGKYTPDHAGLCTHCYWAQRDTRIEGKLIWDSIELYLLRKFYSPFALVSYQAFIETYQHTLLKSPLQKDVSSWWNTLSRKEHDPFIRKYMIEPIPYGGIFFHITNDIFSK